MISSRRSSEIPSGSLESEDAPGNPETTEDTSFQLFDLVHEEGDPETAAAAISSKVSTRREQSAGLPRTDRAGSSGIKSAHSQEEARGFALLVDDLSAERTSFYRLGYSFNKYLSSVHYVPGIVLRFVDMALRT